MPRYDFVCPKCKHEIEVEKSIKDESIPLCCEEDCGGVEMVQLISLSSFQLKGVGWADMGYSKSMVD